MPAQAPDARDSGAAGLDIDALVSVLRSHFEMIDLDGIGQGAPAIGSFAGVAEMNALLHAISSKLDGNVASWVGKDALVPGDFVSPNTAGTYAGEIELDAPAKRVTVELLDQSGLIVHDEDAQAVEKTMLFAWKNAARGPESALRVRVSADGVATRTHVWTPITAVQSPAGGSAARLVTPNGLFALEAALRLR